MERNSTEFFDYVKNNTMTPESTFQFSCEACGNCCRKRAEPILLTGIDILNIARAKQITTRDVIEKYTTTYIGGSSKLPLAVLKEREYDGSCSFLRAGKCSIQNDKPIVCRMYPLGRYFDPRDDSVNYFMIDGGAQCGNPDTAKTWTLKEWLDAFDIKKYDDDTLVWNQVLVNLTKIFIKATSQAEIEKNANLAGKILYFDIDFRNPASYGAQLIRLFESFR